MSLITETYLEGLDAYSASRGRNDHQCSDSKGEAKPGGAGASVAGKARGADKGRWREVGDDTDKRDRDVSERGKVGGGIGWAGGWAVWAEEKKRDGKRWAGLERKRERSFLLFSQT